MYALLYVYEWTDGQVLSFVKKSGWNVKRALSRLRLKQPLSKCSGRGQNDLLTLQCDSGKSREFIEKTTQKHRIWNNSPTFSETIPQQHFLDLELKIIKVSHKVCYVPGVTRKEFRKPKFSYLESQQKALLKFNKIY